MKASGTANHGQIGTAGSPDRGIIDHSKPRGSRKAGRENGTNRHRRTAQRSTTNEAVRWRQRTTMVGLAEVFSLLVRQCRSSAGVFTIARSAYSFPHTGGTALRVALPA